MAQYGLVTPFSIGNLNCDCDAALATNACIDIGTADNKTPSTSGEMLEMEDTVVGCHHDQITARQWVGTIMGVCCFDAAYVHLRNY